MFGRKSKELHDTLQHKFQSPLKISNSADTPNPAANNQPIASEPSSETVFDTSVRFSENFWSSDDRGVNVLIHKLKNAKQTCSDISSLLSARAQLEEDYGKKLLKLSRASLGSEEIGKELEITGKSHITLSASIKKEIEVPLNSLTNQQQISNLEGRLAQADLQWEGIWRTACDVFQQLEEKRLISTNSFFWTLANLLSSVCVSDDEAMERIRVSLEAQSTEKDMAKFIEMFGTGKHEFDTNTISSKDDTRSVLTTGSANPDHEQPENSDNNAGELDPTHQTTDHNDHANLDDNTLNPAIRSSLDDGNAEYVRKAGTIGPSMAQPPNQNQPLYPSGTISQQQSQFDPSAFSDAVSDPTLTYNSAGSPPVSNNQYNNNSESQSASPFGATNSGSVSGLPPSQSINRPFSSSQNPSYNNSNQSVNSGSGHPPISLPNSAQTRTQNRHVSNPIYNPYLSHSNTSDPYSQGMNRTNQSTTAPNPPQNQKMQSGTANSSGVINSNTGSRPSSGYYSSSEIIPPYQQGSDGRPGSRSVQTPHQQMQPSPNHLSQRRSFQGLENIPQNRQIPNQPVVMYVRALYDYAAEAPEELSLTENSVISVLATNMDGWWEGEITDQNGSVRRGLFPSNFTEPVTF
ncbi:hypothetical protein BB560_004156 [Smittium megazygosporum]|uniref:SH3 domain-containing protein n=1 Tax=Smittium megazygosporum TaxID=133381 RepID=A0A2T9ZA03_9FUNG|nr:hypothetical protein BB560_004156 [Smittium megazygosporum]